MIDVISSNGMISKLEPLFSLILMSENAKANAFIRFQIIKPAKRSRPLKIPIKNENVGLYLKRSKCSFG